MPFNTEGPRLFFYHGLTVTRATGMGGKKIAESFFEGLRTIPIEEHFQKFPTKMAYGQRVCRIYGQNRLVPYPNGLRNSSSGPNPFFLQWGEKAQRQKEGGGRAKG